jgi:predicted ATP-grasp superfamily ATP-dependent carboligase
MDAQIIKTKFQGDLSILIPDGESRFALSVVRCLSQVSNVRVHVFSSDPWSRVRFSRYCSSFTCYDGAPDDESILRAIIRTAQKVNANILIPVSESGIRFASTWPRDPGAIVVTALPQLEMFDTAVNKWRFADFMQTHDIPTPQTILFRKDAGFNEQIGDLKFPVLLKPTMSTNGSGIIQFDDSASLERFWEARRNDAREFIIQELVSGYDIDCSVLCRGGEILAYTIQKGIIPNRQRFSPPSAIEFLKHEEVLRVASKLVSDLNWSGVAHIDMMVDASNDRVKVIELNPRYWGSLMGSLKAGVNFPFLAVIAGLDKLLPQVSYRNIRYIEPFAAMQLLMRKPFLHGAGGLPLSESGWRYLLADPLATIAGKTLPLLRKLKLRIFH